MEINWCVGCTRQFFKEDRNEDGAPPKAEEQA